MTPHDHDFALLDDLRRVLDAVDGRPADADELARAALGWRSLDSELAELVHDSAVDEPELVVRGPADSRRALSFANDRVQIDVDITSGQLVGQVMPAVAVVVELYRGESRPAFVTTTDEFGAFVIPDVTSGPLALVCRATDDSWSVRTSWTSL